MATTGATIATPLTRRWWRADKPPAGDDTGAWLRKEAADAKGRAAMLRQYATLEEALPTVRAICRDSLTDRHDNS